LVERGANGVAATVLARVNDLAPGQEAVVLELAAALERDLHFADARRVLEAAPQLQDGSFPCRYALAYARLMNGDLPAAREALLRLRPGADGGEQLLAGRVEGMLRRADAVRGVTALDSRDLRGWHFVLTGGLLLHLSPHGFDEGMAGRYSFVQDSPALVREGLRRLAAVLDAWQLRPPRVFALAGADNGVLAEAAAGTFGCPLEQGPASAGDTAGLVVAYDVGALDADTAGRLQEHRPGQILWGHVSCWTAEPPFAADFATFLYQHNVSPWGARLRINPNTQEAEMIPPSDVAFADRAREVLGAPLEEGALADLPALVALARAARGLAGEHGPGALRAGGRRCHQAVGSPVASNRFL
jgi:hypothetical protein